MKVNHKKQIIAILAIVLFIVIYSLLFSKSYLINQETGEELLIDDVSKLNPTKIQKISENQELGGLKAALLEAKEKGLKVSIAGKRHSMGGHTFYKEAVVLDMNSYNKIIFIDSEKKIIRVESGATWKQIIEAVNPYGLSVKVMQAYNGFTVGGSISVNVHESDPRQGPLIESVKSFRLLKADGTVVNVSREENPELFNAVIGGYGLFGVILDVDLELTEDGIYKKSEKVMDYTEYLDFFRESTSNADNRFIYGRASFKKDETFLREVIASTYETTNIEDESLNALNPSKHLLAKKFIMGISRKYDFGKAFRWKLQKDYGNLELPEIMSRNNLMNGDMSFLEYNSPGKTEILQEYFIPVEKMPEFMDGFRKIMEKSDSNLIGVTIRYVHENTESMLSYSEEEVFGFVLYFNVKTSDKEQKKVQEWTQEMVDLSLSLNGTYYLPYELYASNEQIRKAYPQIDDFFELKRKYDPEEIFMNKFYAKYALGEEDEG